MTTLLFCFPQRIHRKAFEAQGRRGELGEGQAQLAHLGAAGSELSWEQPPRGLRRHVLPRRLLPVPCMGQRLPTRWLTDLGWRPGSLSPSLLRRAWLVLGPISAAHSLAKETTGGG